MTSVLWGKAETVTRKLHSGIFRVPPMDGFVLPV